MLQAKKCAVCKKKETVNIDIITTRKNSDKKTC